MVGFLSPLRPAISLGFLKCGRFGGGGGRPGFPWIFSTGNANFGIWRFFGWKKQVGCMVVSRYLLYDVICINIVYESDFTDPMHHWCLLCFVRFVFALKIERWWTQSWPKKNICVGFFFSKTDVFARKSGRHFLGNPGSRLIRIIFSHQMGYSPENVKWIQILASRGTKKKLAFWEGEKIT